MRGDPESGWDDKAEIQKQWNTDPCGASTAVGFEPGSRAFYGKIDHERYQVYAPWMLGAINFSAHSGARVLEIGPGLGTDHAQFARSGARMFAIDLADAHLEHTRRRFRLEGLHTDAVRGDAERLPFKDGSFDLVYSFGVIHHTPQMAAAIAEVHRVLRPGGQAVIGLYHKHSVFFWTRIMLIRGVLLAGLWRKGYRRVLSEIEYRSKGSTAVPLVQVVTRRDCRLLFDRFSEVRVDSHHVDYLHVVPGLPSSTGWPRDLLERVARRWGWYLLVFARK